MLPAAPQNTQKFTAPEKRIQPGTWWRLVDQEHELTSRDAPEHGLILLVKEVRIVDGMDHTIILEPHPTWTRISEYRALYADFLLSFAEEPNGEALRQAEIDAVMERIQETGRLLQNPPEATLLLEQKTSREASEEKAPDEPTPQSLQTSIVPKELLPSQDVLGAQSLIERRISELNVQREWMEARTSEMKEDMKIVQAYQEEKVTGTLAGISQEQKRAEDLLNNVQTMRLFLGEDIEVHHLVKGKSANASEPLTLLQKLLYLDEEIYISNLIDGFDHTQMNRLPELFESNEGIVQRMMPYPRCMVITRIRRENKISKEMPSTITQMLQLMDEMQQDMLIQIFIRDGENIWMVTADEATSNASRLFPAKQEIDNLFKRNRYFSSDEGLISPEDIDYSDARKRHDDRALFYKRFLIISWGLHEREGIFGPFMPKGENWLRESTHSKHFNFVHDDEDALEDGRLSVHDYISEQNKNIQSGSRAVINWIQATDVDTAPTICEYADYGLRVHGHFDEDVSIATVQAEKASLLVRGAFKKDTYKGHRDIKAKVFLRQPATSIRSRYADRGQPHQVRMAEGFFLLDNASVEDLTYYIESRKARSSYGQYLHAFHLARKLLIEEAQAIDVFFADTNVDKELLNRAVRAWRGSKKWALPSTPKDKTAILKIVAAVEKAAAMDAKGALPKNAEISIRATGKIVVREPSKASIPGIDLVMPWLDQVERPKGSVQLILAEPHTRLGEVSIRNTLPDLSESRGSVPEGLISPKSMEAASRINSTGADVDDLIRLMKGDNSDQLLELALTSFAKYKVINHEGVVLPRHRLDFGLVVGTGKNDQPSAWMISALLNAPSLVCHLGHRDLLKEASNDTYEYPEKALGRVAGKPPISLIAYQLHAERQLSDIWKQGFQLVHEPKANIGFFGSHDLGQDGENLRQYIATEFTPKVPDGNWSTKIDPEACQTNGQKLTYIGAENGEILLQEIKTLLKARKN